MATKPPVEQQWFSPEDAARIGGFSLTTCYELMNSGVLLSKKLGTRRLIYIDSIHNAGVQIRPKDTAAKRPHLARRRSSRRTDPPEAA